MTLFSDFKQQCRQHLPNATHFLIGLSGGIDSVVLLHLFSRTQLNVRAIYIHHSLSPNADSWAEFCKQYCKQLNIPFLLQKIKVDTKKGIENGARIARYQAFKQRLLPNEVLATAHHLDDQAETFFLALKRGSGISGLSAMHAVSYVQNFTIFRPLLSFAKADLFTYAHQHQLTWIEDESNTDNRYDRNFLRNEILPKLNHRWKSFNQIVARTTQHCAEQQLLIEELLNDELAKRIGERQQFCISDFANFSLTKQQQLIRLWLKKIGVVMPNQAQLQAIISELIFAKQDKNPQIKIDNKIIRRYQQAIYVTGNVKDVKDFVTIIPPILCSTSLPQETEKSIILPDSIGSIKRTDNELICKVFNKTYRLQLPLELQSQSLTVKLHHCGKVKLYGKPHREEIKKIWKKHQIPVWERKRTPLIFWQNELVACFPYPLG